MGSKEGMSVGSISAESPKKAPHKEKKGRRATAKNLPCAKGERGLTGRGVI